MKNRCENGLEAFSRITSTEHCCNSIIVDFESSLPGGEDKGTEGGERAGSHSRAQEEDVRVKRPIPSTPAEAK